MNFLTKKEQKVSNDFIKKGYLINKAENNEPTNRGPGRPRNN